MSSVNAEIAPNSQHPALLRRKDARSRRRKSQRRLSLQRIPVWLATICYVVGLIVSLRFVVHPGWEYMGFGWTPWINPLNSAWAIVASILPSAFLPLRFARPSHFILWVLYLLVYVPSMVMPVFANGQIDAIPVYQIVLAFSFLLLWAISELPALDLRRVTVSPGLFWLGIGLFSGVVYVSVVRFFGVPTSLPSLGDVYSVRDEFSTDSARVPVLVSYLLSWQSKIVNPLLIAVGFARRSILLIAAGGVGQVTLYAMTGHKSILFSGLLVMAVLIALAWHGKYMASAASWGAVALVAFCSLVAAVTGSLTLVTLFVRRLIMLPGLLTGYYIDFFSNNPKSWKLDPVTRWIFESPYTERVPRIIGRIYFDSDSTSANANLWADGYAALGLIGVLIVTVVLGAILWAFNSLAIARDKTVASVLAAIPAFSVTNSALFLSIGTHGIGFALVLLWFLPEVETAGQKPDAYKAGNALRRQKSRRRRRQVARSRQPLAQARAK